MLGSGEPLRVRQGQRILLHVLNSSPTEVHWIALAGHELRVIALDGNPVPSPQVVPMLRLAPAERVCALVEMNNPGVWVLGEVRKHVQAAGMGMVVEYAGQGGTPHWQQPADLIWNYAQFASAQPGPEPAQSPTIVPLVFESKFRGHGAMEAWTINGKSYPDSGVAPLEQGRRYRLQFINKSGDDSPAAPAPPQLRVAQPRCTAGSHPRQRTEQPPRHHQGCRAGRPAHDGGSRVHRRQSRATRCFTATSRTTWTSAS